ncbi:ribokinase [Frondihabitans sp. PhB188]|uniref:ribokinase n=1 Tax=Frondihabitans sp. PhB188 TaxID=2485200 RepID=UPI000F4AD86C|nr:ribokinase [Frondihabitans sp. PhB188]ROQ30992.1 ribokinase [Frondihabitans sp. PhB188]
MNPSVALAVVGSINVDLVALAGRLPTPGETVGGAKLHRHPGGKGANQAAAASRLGADVRFIGAVGDDADGSTLIDGLRSRGVDVSEVRRVATPTGIALIVVDAAGENQIVVCPGANAFVSLEAIRFSDKQAVLTQLEIEMDVVLRVAEAASGFLVVNASPAQRLPVELLECVDLFVVNESEYALMPELKQAKLVAVTLGERGAMLLRFGIEIARADGVHARVVNTVGAGDAFCAALTVALASGMPHDRALAAGCAVGAAAVTHPETQVPLEALTHYVGL